jgi:hypothetical protein
MSIVSIRQNRLTGTVPVKLFFLETPTVFVWYYPEQYCKTFFVKRFFLQYILYVNTFNKKRLFLETFKHLTYFLRFTLLYCTVLYSTVSVWRFSRVVHGSVQSPSRAGYQNYQYNTYMIIDYCMCDFWQAGQANVKLATVRNPQVRPFRQDFGQVLATAYSTCRT